jgi:CubicO group peptidase (beta-lactamase class C family)
MHNPMTEAAADVHATADRLASLPMVLGVQVAAVGPDGEVRTAAVGSADVDAGDERPVTTTTRFRPGSITKLLTATMVLQCVEDGLLGLDDPVRHHLPELRLADEGAADRILVRHLLAHSSGIDAADVFVDCGDGDDALARYVELLDGAPLLFEPGRWMSYCNAGFVLAGHLVARARGASWEEVARARVLDPLAMTSTAFETGRQVDEAAAAGDDVVRGHLVAGVPVGVPAGTLTADPMCTRGLAPAGATLTSTAADLARFAAAHVGATPVLSEASARVMQELHAAAPGGVTKQAGMGLAWQVWRGATPADPLRPRIGGANPGQSGLIAVDPSTGTALVVLTNTDQGVNAVNLLLDGFGPAAVPDDDPAPADLRPYVGRYRSHAVTLDIRVGPDDALQLVASDIEEARVGAMRLPGAAGELTYDLDPVDRTTFRTPIGPVAFIDRDDEGRPQLLRWRMRAHRRTDD